MPWHIYIIIVDETPTLPVAKVTNTQEQVKDCIFFGGIYFTQMNC